MFRGQPCKANVKSTLFADNLVNKHHKNNTFRGQPSKTNVKSISVNPFVDPFVNPFVNPVVSPFINPFVGPFVSAFVNPFCETRPRNHAREVVPEKC